MRWCPSLNCSDGANPSRGISPGSSTLSAVSADTALRLAAYFETSAEFWLNLQTRYDLKILATAVGEKVKRAGVATLIGGVNDTRWCVGTG